MFPRGISDTGTVGGTLYDLAIGGYHAFRQNSPNDPVTIPVHPGMGFDINNHDVITGIAIFDSTGYKMYRASPDGVQVLPIMAGDLNTVPNVIDDDGNLVGFTDRTNGTLAAIRYTDALGVVLLNQLVPASSDWDLDPIAGGDYLVPANGTNGAQIVGTGLTGGGLTRGFVMTSDTTSVPASTVMTKIGMPSKFPDDWGRAVSPRAINHSGEVVGVITDYSGISDLNAFVWTEATGLIDLNDYIDPASGVEPRGRLRHQRQSRGRGNGVGQRRAAGDCAGARVQDQAARAVPRDGLPRPGDQRPAHRCLQRWSTVG